MAIRVRSDGRVFRVGRAGGVIDIGDDRDHARREGHDESEIREELIHDGGRHEIRQLLIQEPLVVQLQVATAGQRKVAGASNTAPAKRVPF